MSDSGHVIVMVDAPASKLTLTFEYAVAEDVYQVLAGDGLVEARAEFGYAVCVEEAPQEFQDMVASTPGYLEDLAMQMQDALNQVSAGDVCTFIEAMMAAGTPEQMTEEAWAEVWEVYENVNDGGGREAGEVTCIEILVDAPGGSTSP